MRLLDLFSSIWTGVVLLALLFVYSSIGSAVPAFRQLPFLEMTEFEWFHWWPFKTLIALICVTLVTTTVRRIPFKPINYGVWMIHSGIIVLAVGSVVYFTTKVEGDSPVVRRQLVARVGGGAPVSVVAMPGNSVVAGTPDNPYVLRVTSIDPQWEILSGEDAGKRVYSVNVAVQTPRQTFIRQLLAGFPQYTEDLVRSEEPGGPPWARARKVLGRPIVDDQLELALEYEPQRWYYLSNDIAKSWALYLREITDDGASGPWVQRPIEGLPLYNDRIADLDDVWLDGAVTLWRPRPLSVSVPAVAAGDPMAGIPIEITSYLRYAVPDTRRRIGGGVFDPSVRVRVQAADGRAQEYQLVALDPTTKMQEQGRLVFEWISDEPDLEKLLEVRAPVLTINAPAAPPDVKVPIERLAGNDPDFPFTAVEGTDYSYRVTILHDGLRLPTGEVISVAVVELKTPQRTFVRWVSDDPSKTRDLAADVDASSGHGAQLALDTGITLEYEPGLRPAPVTIVGGPGDGELRLVLTVGDTPPRVQPLPIRTAVELGSGITLTVQQAAAYTSLETRPAVVPRAQRDADARAQRSMIQVTLDGGQTQWLQFHHWLFDDASQALGRAPFRPTEVTLADGRRIEMMFSRQRRKLPSPVVLEDFVMDTHAGGFSGQNLSVLNWTSIIRFLGDDGPTEPMNVSVNSPVEYGGLSYFQAQWDPPDPAEGYGGLNYTVLGVGNRHGVNVMLAGCCIAVLGMIYAFYVKPAMKRRRARAAYARIAAERGGDLLRSEPLAVGAAAVNGEDRR